MTGPPRRFKTIVFLRAAAASAVCLFHFTNGNPMFRSDPAIGSFGRDGHLGIHVFFLISGFVIPWFLFQSNYRVREFMRYMTKRIVRLHPPYLASIAVILCLNLLPTRNAAASRWPDAVNVVLHAGYLSPFFDRPWLNPVFWTLSVEFQYYVLIGLLYPLLTHPRVFVRTASIFASFALGVLCGPHTMLAVTYAPLFIAGIAVFLRVSGIARWPETLIYLGTAIIVSAGLHPLLPWILAVAAALILFTEIGNPVTDFLGNISFSLYLLHVPVGGRVINLFSWMSPDTVGKTVAVVCAFAASTAAAYVFYRVVERPSLTWSHRIRMPGAPPRALPVRGA